MDADELADDLQSMSFNSTTTTAETVIRSPSSSSETTWTASSSFPAAAGDAIRLARDSSASLSFSDVRFICRLGSGDIGSVFLADLKSAEGVYFAAKVMDKKELVARDKQGRARAEREILEMLGDHPFLPTLYAAVESPKWSCLLTEFCPGGDLHILRQRQPLKRFDESTVRFYASEVIAALEYVHMMGIVYRDLKPENVLVRSDGHIMLTDFDLSLMCDDASTPTPQIVLDRTKSPTTTKPQHYAPTSCILPAVSCFHSRRPRKKKDRVTGRGPGRPEFVAEPVDVRSMSFVGTHEYLAPEIVSGEGHGSAVDWWTLGVFMFELFYGVTPFKGGDNELTLANIVARALEFPKEPSVPGSAKDLISQLLVKDPDRRLGTRMGAGPIKRHPFFQGVNWALLRCTPPPFVPPPFSRDVLSEEDDGSSCPDTDTPVDYY
ncbi:hypothetical protein V2J09_019245 [Rumex salicifolius]